MERCVTTSDSDEIKTDFEDLKVRKETEEGSDYNQNLSRLRVDIDEYDAKLLEILGKRMVVADKIGALKKKKMWPFCKTKDGMKS